MGWGYLKTSWEALPGSLPAMNCLGRAVLSQICRFADDGEEGGGLFFVSQECIAKSTGMSLRSVQKQIALLAEMGYIAFVRKKVGQKGCKTMNYYRLLFPVNDTGKGSAKPHGVRIAKARGMRGNRNVISCSNDIAEAGSNNAALSIEELKTIASRLGIPDSFVQFFVSKSENLVKADGARLVRWWNAERRKDKYLNGFSCVDGNVQPRRISEDDL